MHALRPTDEPYGYFIRFSTEDANVLEEDHVKKACVFSISTYGRRKLERGLRLLLGLIDWYLLKI